MLENLANEKIQPENQSNQNMKRCKGYTDFNGVDHKCGIVFDNKGFRGKLRCPSCTKSHNRAKREFKKWVNHQPQVRCKGFTDSEGKYHSCDLMVKSHWKSGRCGACNAKQKIAEIERKKFRENLF